jgi:hypothetical protein
MTPQCAVAHRYTAVAGTERQTASSTCHIAVQSWDQWLLCPVQNSRPPAQHTLHFLCCPDIKTQTFRKLAVLPPSDSDIHLQLSSTRGHCCWSNGNFCRFIKQKSVTFILKHANKILVECNLSMCYMWAMQCSEFGDWLQDRGATHFGGQFVSSPDLPHKLWFLLTQILIKWIKEGAWRSQRFSILWGSLRKAGA